MGSFSWNLPLCLPRLTMRLLVVLYRTQRSVARTRVKAPKYVFSFICVSDSVIWGSWSVRWRKEERGTLWTLITSLTRRSRRINKEPCNYHQTDRNCCLRQNQTKLKYRKIIILTMERSKTGADLKKSNFSARFNLFFSHKSVFLE